MDEMGDLIREMNMKPLGNVTKNITRKLRCLNLGTRNLDITTSFKVWPAAYIQSNSNCGGVAQKNDMLPTNHVDVYRYTD